MKEKRREKRIALDPVDLISAEFTIGKGSEKGQSWRLDVYNCSNYGLGLLISGINSELLQILNPGDLIEDMTLFSEWSMITVNATVIHIEKIKQGRCKDQHILGMESDEIIEICRPR